MKYSAPKAELVWVELSSDVLLGSFGCIIDFTETGEGGGDKLPDFYVTD